MDRSAFKDKHLIFTIVHYNLDCVKVSLRNFLSILDQRDDCYLVIFDSHSEASVRSFIQTIDHPRVDKMILPLNLGDKISINFYIQDYISESNLPKTISFFDPDIVFNAHSFDLLLKATQLPQFAVLGMNYRKNGLHHTIGLGKLSHLLLPPKIYSLKNGEKLTIKQPLLAPIAGSIYAYRGEILRDDLQYEPFQMKYIPKKYRHYTAYGGDDSALYNALNRYKHGYILDTECIHMKDRYNSKLDIPKEYQHFLD